MDAADLFSRLQRISDAQSVSDREFISHLCLMFRTWPICFRSTHICGSVYVCLQTLFHKLSCYVRNRHAHLSGLLGVFISAHDHHGSSGALFKVVFRVGAFRFGHSYSTRHGSSTNEHKHDSNSWYGKQLGADLSAPGECANSYIGVYDFHAILQPLLDPPTIRISPRALAEGVSEMALRPWKYS